MPRVTGIFVSPSGLINQVIGGIVKAATNSQFSHAAVGFEDYLVEAVAPQVSISPLYKYADEPVLVVVEVPVTTQQYNAGLTAANKLVGLPYGLGDCLIGGVTDIFGKKYGEELAKYMDDTGTLNCSAVYTMVFRAMFPHFLEGRAPSTITPQVAYDATVELLNQEYY